MDVRRIQQVIQPIERLKRKQGHVWAVGHESFEPRAKSSVTAEDKVNPRVVLERFRQRSQQFEAMLRAHVAGVKQDDLLIDARNLRCKFAAKYIGMPSSGERIDRLYFYPIGEEYRSGEGRARKE